MITTKALLNPFNAIFAKIHHPPPLDKRESQRLLNALTTSFRRNLDEEHGYWQHDAHSTSSLPPSATSSTKPSSSARSSIQDSHRRPTDRHVRAILSNPLFSYDTTKVAPSREERDPMDVFDQAVANGLMNPQRAAGVLIAKRQAIAQSPSISVHESMAASGTALRVVQWLRSSGLERNLSFLTNQPLINNLVPFMVEEGLEEVSWAWLDAWMQTQDHMTSRNGAFYASKLLSALLKAKTSPGAPLDHGYATLIRASDMFRDYQNFELAALEPWRLLSVWSTVFAWQRARPSEALFDAFAAMSEQLLKISKALHVDRAHLDLHHPVHPDATLAVKYIKSAEFESLRNRLEQGTRADRKKADNVTSTHLAKSMAKRVGLMITDTAQHLTRTGQEAEAARMGNLVVKTFGHLLRRDLGKAGLDLHMFQQVPSAG